MSFFTVIHRDQNTYARAGLITTDHGVIETPTFMPVGTQATVKSLDVEDLNKIGAQIILNNTYHLHLRPGEGLVRELGGLHNFMHWDKPILTDSGGYQVFSLGLGLANPRDKKTAGFNASEAKKKILNQPREDETIQPLDGKTALESYQGKLVNINEDGVTFRSHLDGSLHNITPEKAIDIQHQLGADIIMAFDECTPDDVSIEYAREAMERTHRWAVRSLNCHTELQKKSPLPNQQSLFGIIQGANFKELRAASAKFICALPFAGIALGGESVGYNMAATRDILDWVMPIIPKDKPLYTMGVGYSPADLFTVVEKGVDMFDCVGPTRIARNGTLFVHKEINQTYKININNAQFRADSRPVDPACSCFTCAHHTRAYLHHLFNARELLAYRLATLHNLHFILTLMAEMRQAIAKNKFSALKQNWI